MKNIKNYTTLSKIFFYLFGLSAYVFYVKLTLWGEDNNAFNWIGGIAGIAFISMVITGIGTLSMLILGWRNEKRNSTETKLKIEKLELEIAELKSKEEEKKPKITLK